MDVDRRVEYLGHQVASPGTALDRRTVIGEALGIVMERLSVDDLPQLPGGRTG